MAMAIVSFYDCRFVSVPMLFKDVSTSETGRPFLTLENTT